MGGLNKLTRIKRFSMSRINMALIKIRIQELVIVKRRSIMRRIKPWKNLSRNNLLKQWTNKFKKAEHTISKTSLNLTVYNNKLLKPSNNWIIRMM